MITKKADDRYSRQKANHLLDLIGHLEGEKRGIEQEARAQLQRIETCIEAVKTTLQLLGIPQQPP